MVSDDQARNELFGSRPAANQQFAGTSSANAEYSAEHQQMLQEAKRKNRETTALALEAAKIAAQTEETAVNTVAELHRQDAQLDKAQKDIDNIEADVEEAKRALSYMERCCLLFCCACCCDCDNDAARDKTRKQRIAQREELTTAEKRHADLVAQEKSGKVLRTTNGEAPVTADEQEMQQRGQLLGAEQRAKAATNPAFKIGEGLADEDRDEIQQDIRVQEKALDEIDKHLDNIMRMANEMGDQLTTTDIKIEDIASRGDKNEAAVIEMRKKMAKMAK